MGSPDPKNYPSASLMYEWVMEVASKTLELVRSGERTGMPMTPALARAIKETLLVILATGLCLPPWRLWVIRTLFHKGRHAEA